MAGEKMQRAGIFKELLIYPDSLIFSLEVPWKFPDSLILRLRAELLRDKMLLRLSPPSAQTPLDRGLSDAGALHTTAVVLRCYG